MWLMIGVPLFYRFQNTIFGGDSNVVRFFVYGLTSLTTTEQQQQQ